MGDLAAFLAARLDEEDANARDAQPQWLSTHFTIDPGSLVLVKFHRDHDPVRVLREVEAGRAILADYEEAAQHPYDLPEGVREGRDDDERERDAYLINVLEDVLRHLAAVYRDHPDYDPAWVPG